MPSHSSNLLKNVASVWVRYLGKIKPDGGFFFGSFPAAFDYYCANKKKTAKSVSLLLWGEDNNTTRFHASSDGFYFSLFQSMAVELREDDDYQTPIWPTGPLDFGADDSDDDLVDGRSESALVVLHDRLITDASTSFHLMDAAIDTVPSGTYSITIGSRGQVEIVEDTKPIITGTQHCAIKKHSIKTVRERERKTPFSGSHCIRTTTFLQLQTSNFDCFSRMLYAMLLFSNEKKRETNWCQRGNVMR